jgi:hypothetical protein
MSLHPRVRLRLTWRQRRAFVIAVLAYQVLVWADLLFDDGRFGGNLRTALVGAVFLVMAAATWWIGTSATRRGLVVHAVPPMIIPWSDVHEIEVQTKLGRKVVVVHHAARQGEVKIARRTTLSAPFHGPIGRDEQFQDKVSALRTYWAAQRATAGAA